MGEIVTAFANEELNHFLGFNFTQSRLLMLNSRFLFNPFLANAPILYPLQTPENQRFSGVFRGYKIGTLARNVLNSKTYWRNFF